MKNPSWWPRATLTIAILLIGTGSLARAQEGLAAPTSPSPPVPEMDEETVILSPFVVEAGEDPDTYQARATLAGSRIRTELKDVGSAISVVTSKFLQDTGATSSETLLQYTISTEISGAYGNFAGLGDGKSLDDVTQRMAPHQNTRVRGLSQADNTRDFFLTDIPWDSFNVGRVDLQRGPNAILFGIGKPAGIINASVNGAMFKQAGQVELRYGSFGSARGAFDWNQVLRDNELALRVSLLDDHTKYRQEPAYNRDKRFFGALRFDPEFLTRGDAHTQFNLKFETGQIRANRPHILPPGDLISPWWTDAKLISIRQAGGINPLTVGIKDEPTIARLRAQGDLAVGAREAATSNYDPVIGTFGRNYGGIVAVFPDRSSGQHTLMTTDIPKNVTSVVTLPWTTMSGVPARKDLEGTRQSLTNYDFYRDEVLRDPGIFDFHHNLLEGPNKREWSDFDGVTASLAQTFLNNQLGLEAAYDHQNYERGQVNLLSEFGQSITIDMNNHLVDGSVNPNYGRACVISDQWANNSYVSDRTSKRLTAFGDLETRKLLGENLASRIIGRHVITGLFSNETFELETRSWRRYAADATYGLQILQDPLLRNRTVNTLNYLTPASLAGASSLSGAGIGRIEARQVPSAGEVKVFDMTWNPATETGGDGGVWERDDVWIDQYGATSTQGRNPANYVGWGTASEPSIRGIGLLSDEAGARENLTDNAALRKVVTRSYAGNWQAYLWDGVFVPSLGLRQDEQKSYALPTKANTLRKQPDGSDIVDFSSPQYSLPDEPDSVVKGNTTSWSLVLHTPPAIRDRLPGHTDLTLFYNRSANFEPAAGRIDVGGNDVASPDGKTKDYGLMLTAFDDRLTFRVNRYETTTKNAKLDGFGGLYMLLYSEAWGYDFARGNLLRTRVGGWADFTSGYQPVGSQTVAQAQAIGDAISHAYLDSRPSDEWFQLWNINTAAADLGSFITPGRSENDITITGDTSSQGYEYEINAQPRKNWNIAINASKTTAQRLNMAQSIVDWVENRWEAYHAPVMLDGQSVGVVGDVRFWSGAYDANETLLGKFTREFMSGYWLYRIQEGANVPELRPWRFNLVTNYGFDEGRFQGVNVGAAYRWQDRLVVGYPILPGATIDDPRAFDLEHPYKGPTESSVDFWVGYQRKLGEKVNWRLQLNVRNVFADDDLIPVTVQPNGSLAVGRIPEPRTWTITNTFSF